MGGGQQSWPRPGGGPRMKREGDVSPWPAVAVAGLDPQPALLPATNGQAGDKLSPGRRGRTLCLIRAVAGGLRVRGGGGQARVVVNATVLPPGICCAGAAGPRPTNRLGTP